MDGYPQSAAAYSRVLAAAMGPMGGEPMSSRSGSGAQPVQPSSASFVAGLGAVDGRGNQADRDAAENVEKVTVAGDSTDDVLGGLPRCKRGAQPPSTSQGTTNDTGGMKEEPIEPMEGREPERDAEQKAEQALRVHGVQGGHHTGAPEPSLTGGSNVDNKHAAHGSVHRLPGWTGMPPGMPQGMYDPYGLAAAGGRAGGALILP